MRPGQQATLFYWLAAQSYQRSVIQQVTKDTGVRFPPAHLLTGKTAADIAPRHNYPSGLGPASGQGSAEAKEGDTATNAASVGT